MGSRCEVCVVGGGITGAGIARDLALRGVEVVLLEKGDLAVGSTGRSHGLVHSGARYAVTDPETARQCASENRILRKIAPGFIHATGGLFAGFGEEDLSYLEEFLKACSSAGVEAREISPEEALEQEPQLNPGLLAAVEVEDAVADPFLLTVANAFAAHREGAQIETYARVVEVEGDRVSYLQNGKRRSIKAEVVVNASGVWAGEVAKLAGREVEVRAYRGTILVYRGRAVRRVVNHLRRPSQGDIILPHASTTLVGTSFAPETRLEKFSITRREVELLKKEGEAKVPSLKRRSIIRAYAGLRPVVGGGEKRGFTILEDGNFITVAGGKFTTYRLMAERASDAACRLLGVRANCVTAREEIVEENTGELRSVLGNVFDRVYARYGPLATGLLPYASKAKTTCLCEGVTEGEVLFAAMELFCRNIRDIRRRTRLGMGYCQGRRCTLEAAMTLFLEGLITAPEAQMQVVNSLRERWKGMLPVAEANLKEAKLMEATYACAGNYDRIKRHISGLVSFL
ncbi:FAD-dependent oxidoreductase [Candidatus Pyrohabitans sp.]